MFDSRYIARKALIRAEEIKKEERLLRRKLMIVAVFSACLLFVAIVTFALSIMFADNSVILPDEQIPLAPPDIQVSGDIEFP